ncbi:uncharacterized protein [Montipora foliosa]|uniref:uncharacterized protein n=1 Tax=Montipora foliosa TaxID=591990 RepID=UPI0035F1802E
MAEKKKVKNLIKFRDSHRNFVRKTIAEAKDLISGGNPIEVRKLKLLRTSLQTKCSELQVLDRDIVELLEDVSKIDSDVSESCELICVIQECMVDLESALTAQEPQGKNQQSNSLESAGTAQGHLQAVHTHARLPKLELKKFHGNPIEWYPFWESFESAVHKNSNLSGVDKFNYLKSLLTGITQSVVTGLALTSANYEKAVELLKRRFGNRQVVISSHMEALTKIPKVASASEVKRLRSLYDTVESHVRGLESMEISSEMYGCFLTPIIMQKLPEEFRIAISRNLESETWDLKEILSEFHKELQLREQCLVNPKDVRPSNSFQRGESLQSTSALYSESAKNKQFSRVWCSFCNQNHQSSKCNVVTSAESRKQVLRKKGRCYLCLKSGHLPRNCKSPVKCFKCQGAHHVAICDSFEGTVSGPEQVENVPNVSTSLYVDQYRGSVLLQTATCEVVRPDNDSSPLNVRLVFDSCSQRSYVTQAVKEKLQLPVVGRDSLLIKTFGESDARLRTCEIVQVGIKTLCDTTVYIQAYVVPVICGPLTQQSTELTQSSYEHLRDLPLADRADGGVLAVSILVGADYYWSLVEGTLVRGAPWEPVALATKLGFVLSGPTMVMCDNVHANTVNLTATHVLKVESSVINHDDLAAELKKFWDYESFGIHDDNATLYDKFVNEVEFVEGRYQVRLPFKEDHDLLPDNFALCKSRLVSLLRRLSVKPDVSRQYNDVIREQLKQGIIEPVDQGTTNGVGKVHYIPHHEVIRVDKETTKLRVVYDASAKAQSTTPSLNDCLYAGPPLSSLIYDILLRFRVHKVAISGDIEKAFLNISVDPRDRDYLRFLWVDDTGSKHPNLQVYRFARVAFGISSSPFLLNATIRHHLTSTDLPEEFVDCVLKSLYVDDFVGGEDSDDLVFEMFKNLKSSFKGGGFNMRKWVSNSTLVQKRIEEHERESPLDVEISTKPVEECKIQEEDQTFSSSQFRAKDNPCSVRCKVLGIGWDTESDMFSLNLASPIETNNGCPITKRSILAATSKLYDPLGILSPVIILWKIIFQSVCKSKMGWDDPVEMFIHEQWLKLTQDLKMVGVVQLKRHYFHGKSLSELQSVQLHGFADASERAYGAVVYLRVELTDGTVFTELVTSRTRVAPINGDTIPRLELLGALVLARLINSVLTAFEGTLRVDSVFCWSDSQIALWWIWGVNREFKQFVQNRVVEIRGLVKPARWDYCPSENNPADICSRGSLASKLVANQLWWNGPEFLLKGKDAWPNLPVNPEVISTEPDTWLQLKKESSSSQKKQHNSTVLANVVADRVTSERKLNLDCIIPLKGFSSLQRLVRVTAYVMRFVSNLKRKNEKKELTDEDLKQEEIERARELWIREVQGSVLDDEKFDQVKVSLSLYKDDKGILRCGGRLKNAPIPFNARFPIFLPRSSHFTNLVINECHLKVLHNGVRETLTELRSCFWVVKGRQAVKTVIGKCSVCKKIEGRSYAVPRSPPLPEFRLSDEFAFSRVGVDFAGPMYVRDIFAKGGGMNKVYIALFTCATSRAVHLELVPSLTAESFIKALARFKGRRGTPTLIVSDNGKTFKDSRVQAYCQRDGTKWRFNVEAAPWWGGFFERLVKSVKLSLKKCLRNARLNYDELSTTLVEVEAVLNSRPLTYVYDEFEEPLTPSHLVIGRRILSMPPKNYSIDVPHTQQALSRRAKFLQSILDHFWNRWRAEYLTQLREQHRCSKRVSSLRKVQVGDVVCIHEKTTPRQLWRLGRVQRLLPGPDGEVRSAVVKVKSGNLPSSEWRRPLQRLYPLEVKLNTEPDNAVPITVVRDEDVPAVVVNPS